MNEPDQPHMWMRCCAAFVNFSIINWSHYVCHAFASVLELVLESKQGVEELHIALLHALLLSSSHFFFTKHIDAASIHTALSHIHTCFGGVLVEGKSVSEILEAHGLEGHGFLEILHFGNKSLHFILNYKIYRPLHGSRCHWSRRVRQTTLPSSSRTDLHRRYP